MLKAASMNAASEFSIRGRGKAVSRLGCGVFSLDTLAEFIICAIL